MTKRVTREIAKPTEPLFVNPLTTVNTVETKTASIHILDDIVKRAAKLQSSMVSSLQESQGLSRAGDAVGRGFHLLRNSVFQIRLTHT